MRELLAASARKPLTAEALLTWSSYAYPDEHRDRFGNAIPPHETEIPGWRVIAHIDDRESGYYGMAVYNPLTHEVVIINRGTEFTADEFGSVAADDAAAAIDIFQGRMTRQLEMSQLLLQRVWAAFSLHRKKPKFYATGHSLGGAAAQFQVAAAYANPQQFRGIQIYGVTFCGCGRGECCQRAGG